MSRTTRRARAESFAGVLRYWGPLAVWLFALFYYSTDVGSARHTSRLLRPLVELLLPGAADVAVVALNAAARKTVHVVTYGALALLAYRALRRGRPERWSGVWAAQAFFVTTMYAMLDEYLQLYYGGRSGSMWDVVTDMLGGLLALTMMKKINHEGTRGNTKSTS